MSDEDYWKNAFGDGFNTFKLRSSWGQAGNLTALEQTDRLSEYFPVNVGGLDGLVPSSKRGNENVKPERQDEFEIGFDASFVNGRIGLEFTYYNQKITDLLLNEVLAPSTGFTNQFSNVGEMKNNGVEVLVRAAAIKNESFTWDVTATLTTNDNEVTSTGGDGNILILDGSFATSAVIEGESLGVFYRQFYARDENGNITLDENGRPSTGTTEDGNNRKVIGDPNPDWFGSLINEFSYRNFNLRLQLDAVQGYDVFNWNRRLLDNTLFGGGPQAGEELLGNLPKGYGRSQGGIFEEFVEDGSFVKLREFSLSYDWQPKNWGSVENIRISFVGRNLISWDSYSGWDPETNTPGQSNGVRGFDFAAVPIPATYQLGISMSF